MSSCTAWEPRVFWRVSVASRGQEGGPWVVGSSFLRRPGARAASNTGHSSAQGSAMTAVPLKRLICVCRHLVITAFPSCLPHAGTTVSLMRTTNALVWFIRDIRRRSAHNQIVCIQHASLHRSQIAMYGHPRVCAQRVFEVATASIGPLALFSWGSQVECPTSTKDFL